MAQLQSMMTVQALSFSFRVVFLQSVYRYQVFGQPFSEELAALAKIQLIYPFRQHLRFFFFFNRAWRSHNSCNRHSHSIIQPSLSPNTETVNIALASVYPTGTHMYHFV